VHIGSPEGNVQKLVHPGPAAMSGRPAFMKFIAAARPMPLLAPVISAQR
jgi:hypothetical protein